MWKVISHNAHSNAFLLNFKLKRGDKCAVEITISTWEILFKSFPLNCLHVYLLYAEKSWVLNLWRIKHLQFQNNRSRGNFDFNRLQLWLVRLIETWGKIRQIDSSIYVVLSISTEKGIQMIIIQRRYSRDLWSSLLNNPYQMIGLS